MKFLSHIILISSCLSLNLAYPYDAPNTLEPSHLLFCLYSKPHSLQPKNVAPNTFSLTQETPVTKVGMNVLLAFSPKYLYSMMVDTLYAHEHGPYLQLPLKYKHFQNYISVSTNHGTYFVNRLGELDNDTLSPKQCGNSNYLLNGSYIGSLTFNKTKKFMVNIFMNIQHWT